MTLFGSEVPRIYTPELRDLSDPASTLGYECCEFAESVGVHLFPWERWLLIHALELNADGSLRFRTIILLVARQNGKTTILKILALFWMYVLGRLLVIGTAQNLDIAETTWADAVALAESSEELSPYIEQVVRQSGKKSLVLDTGETYKAKASTGRGPRGLTGDLVQMDELREHHTWEAWAGVSSTIMAVQSALVIAASNAGDLRSVVLRQLRFMCMSDPATVGVVARELEAFGVAPVAGDEADDLGDADSVGIFEWSAPPECGLWDRAGWAAANPSLGYTITESAMATQAKVAAAGGDAEWVFRTENLCQWRPTGGSGPFPDGAWDAGVDQDSRIADSSRVALCVDVSHDRGMSYVAVAGFNLAGDVHVQVAAMRAGTDWLKEWLLSPERVGRDRWIGVTWQLSGAPVSSLTDEFRESGLPCVDWGGPDLARAHGIMFDLVRQPKVDPETGAPDPDDVGKRRVWHVPQPALDVPASMAVTRPLGEGWVVDRRRSPVDAAPLVAVIGATWLLLRPEEKTKKPRVHEWPEELLAAWGG